MSLKPIHSAKDHAATLKEIERLWKAKRGTPNGDKFEVLSALVDAYEREHLGDHLAQTPPEPADDPQAS